MIYSIWKRCLVGRGYGLPRFIISKGNLDRSDVGYIIRTASGRLLSCSPPSMRREGKIPGSTTDGRREGGRKWRGPKHPKDAVQELVNMPRMTTRDVNEMVMTHVQDLSLVDLVKLLHACSKQRHVVISKKSISRINDQVQQLRASKLTGPQIGKIMYSMKQFSSDDYRVRELLKSVSALIEKNEEVLPSYTVANMLYGLCGMDAKHWEVRLYLKVLTKKLVESTQPLKYFEVSCAMYGLRGMTCRYREVLDVVSVMARKIESSPDLFNGQVVSNCLYGMQNFSSKHDAVRYLLSVISHKIELTGLQGGESLSGQGFGNALFGLQGMSSERLEVRRLLRALTPKLEGCEQPLTAQAVGNALFGLQRMKSEQMEVRRLLVVLVPKIHSCFHSLSVQNIDNAFFGLQNMSSDHEEVRAILAALQSKLGAKQLDSHAFGSVLFGLKCMKCEHDEVRSLLTAFTASLPTPQGLLRSREQLLAKDFAMAFYGLRLMRDETHEVNELLQRVYDLIITCEEDFGATSLVSILNGMQSMTAVHSEVTRKILSFVSSRLAGLRGRVVFSEAAAGDMGVNVINASMFSRAMLGLKSMRSEVREVREVISALADMLESDQGLQGHFSLSDLRDVVAGLMGMSVEHSEVRRIVSALSVRIRDPGRCYALAKSERECLISEIHGLRHTLGEDNVATLCQALRAEKTPLRIIESDVDALTRT